MKQPWLIQRCELDGGKLKYDYMGSSGFEVGDQSKSLKRIFASGPMMRTDTVMVSVEGKDVAVHMLAGEGFTFADYQPYLQQLVEDKLRLQEFSGFDAVVRTQLGLTSGHFWTPKANVWFDFQNDVLWTLTEDNLKTLVSVLSGIRRTWATKTNK